MYKGSKQFRDSITVSIPENYVTIQLRNKDIKKKYRHHRSSVLHQIHATQSILNNSLNKITPHVKSAFITPKSSVCKLRKKTKQTDFWCFMKEKEKKLKQNKRNDSQREPKYRICQEIQSKLKQITNISYHFDQACVQKPKKLKTQASEISLKLFLPNVDEDRDKSETKKKLHQKKIPKNWIRKLRNGKSLAEKMRKKLSLVKFQNQRPIKQVVKINEQQNNNELRKEMQQGEKQAKRANKISLRELYFRKQEERKSAPISNRNNTFYKLFCSVRGSKEQGFRQKMRVQSEQVRKLQQFVRGVEMSEYKQYDSLVHIGDFIRDKQNFKVLKKMYNYVKEKYAYQFKEMNLQEMKESTLLSLVYYLENKHNMSELDKKNWKAKMNFIE